MRFGVKTARLLTEEHPYAIIFSAWVLLQIIILKQYGIVTGFEATKYIVEADALLETGNYSSGNFLFYSTQILLNALSKLTGTFPWLVVVFQVVINAVAVYFFYRLCLKFTGSIFRSVITTLVFLSMFYYHIYNFYLFTESIYFSLGILFSYFLFSINQINARNILLLFLFISLVYFTRPLGVFFIPATIVYIILRFYKRKALLLFSFLTLIGITALYFLLNFALNSGGEFDFLLPYLDERIICGVPTIEQPHNLVLPVEKNSVEGLWYIITRHPDLFIRLAARRFFTFWGMTRPFYSTPHNIFIAVYFYTMYVLILWKVRLLFKNFLAETSYFLTIIFFIMVTVMLSCDEWHNRFILALLPFFLLMATAYTGSKNNKLDVNQPVE